MDVLLQIEAAVKDADNQGREVLAHLFQQTWQQFRRGLVTSFLKWYGRITRDWLREASKGNASDDKDGAAPR